MNYLQAPANAGLTEIFVLTVVILVIFFVINEQKKINAKKGMTVSSTKDSKDVTIEGLSRKLSSSGYQLQIAGKNLLSTIYVLIVLAFLNFYFLNKMSNNTDVNNLLSVKGDLKILIVINVIGVIIIFIFQLIGFTSIKKSGDYLVS